MWGAISKHRTAFWFWAGLCAAVFASRLCHCGILWIDEDYHIAAGIQALYDRMPYRDLWYDKPVLNVLFYLLLGAPTGCLLRLAGAAYVCGACALAYRFASRIWTKREGCLAAAMLAFSLIFYLPAAVMPLEPDTLMIAPHLAAIYFAWFRRPFWAGIAAAFAFLFNVKGLFVLASCALTGAGGFPLLLGFALPNAAALGWLYWIGAIPDYWRQVWVWGVHYSGLPMSQSPVHGIEKTLNWAGFHSVLVIGAAFAWRKDHETFFRLASWTFISAAAAAMGWRFAPHYFNQVLPPLVISAARGISLLVEIRPAGLMRRTAQITLAIALVIPGVRFGPRYALLARDNLLGMPHQWKDLEWEEASRQSAQRILSIAKRGDTVYIWGSWPRIIAYSRLPVGSRLWDSQPVTGVPADWHFKSTGPVAGEEELKNLRELAQTKPSILVDELGVLNPNLAMQQFSELRPWLSNYCLECTLPMMRIYKRCADTK